MTDAPTRRLVAILFADVAGFTRMVEADENGTLAALRARRAGVIEPVVAAHGGRVVKHIGDGVMAEFASAVNAVGAALRLQADSLAADAGLPDDRHLKLRIGINLGDIVGEGDDIFGDGVNVASRLQGLAQPGGIVASAKVRDEVAGKLDVTFTDLGEQRLKNHAAPVRAYAVGSVARSEAAPSLPEDARMSIAVLPFTSLGADPDQQYFGDGVTEDIITELARNPILQVASRNGSFRFRGPDADIAAAARTLGVRYVVEGSIRRMGPRIRITAQLIDTATGAHLWAERYDRPADEIFDVQDDVVRTIVGTLVGRLQSAGAEQARRRPPASLAAYDLILQAEHRDWTNADARVEVRALARRALDIDPGMARAELMLGFMSNCDWVYDVSLPDSTLEVSLVHMRRAVALDPNDFYCHIGLGQVYLYTRAYDMCERHLSRALTLNPNRPGVHSMLAVLALYSGRPEEALERMEASQRIDPFHEPRWYWSTILIMAYAARRYDMALDAFRRIDQPRDWVRAYAAAAHAMLGDEAAARAEAAAVLAMNPKFSSAASLSRDPFRNAADLQHFVDGMARAGLPP
jgi:adenylate cyclase